ncbi:hypothetical protein MUN78_04505 [Leucobacter allii]|uniref:Uncharacterized protein n=1 Tax=Leucobacter allii TaxID=2932247 RepID=A0ABY4FPA1_9MICO|nr:hypothetical protein [Leucobacter allii]UOQ58113.1 hypothetical protein MUN78_04505 [Leucobacter allii]
MTDIATVVFNGRSFGPFREGELGYELVMEIRRLQAALARAAAPEPVAQEAFDPFLSPAEVQALPVGSVVMTETDPAVFGAYEQRVWQRFGGEPDWQFRSPRHEWQSTDGGFQRVEDRDWPPVFSNNRRVRLLYTPGPLPVGGESDGE